MSPKVIQLYFINTFSAFFSFLLVGNMPSIIEWLQWFFKVHRTMDSTAHSRQFGALYIHRLDEKHPTRPGLEPSTSELSVLLPCSDALFLTIFRHLKLEMLTQFPAPNDEKLEK